MTEVSAASVRLGAVRVVLREIAARSAADGNADMNTLARLGLQHLARAERGDGATILRFPGGRHDR